MPRATACRRTATELLNHAFIGGGGGNLWIHYQAWLQALGLENQVAMHHATSGGLLSGVRSGFGIAVLPCIVGDSDPDLIQCLAANDAITGGYSGCSPTSASATRRASERSSTSSTRGSAARPPAGDDAPGGRIDLDVVRAGPLAQLFVMHQRRLRPEGHRLPVAERPFPAVAVLGPDIAVDVEAALVV